MAMRRVRRQQPGVGDRALGNHAHAGAFRFGQHLFESGLIDDVEGDLKHVEDAHRDRLQGIIAVAAVARVAHLARVVRPQQGVCRFTGAQYLRRARVQKDEVEAFEPHPSERAINAVLDDGGTAITVTNGGRVELSNVNLDDAVIKIASNASARIYADELDEITIYSGIAKFKGNVGAPIQVGAMFIYGGMVDARTDSGTFATTSATRVYGGRLLLDPATNAAIA